MVFQLLADNNKDFVTIKSNSKSKTGFFHLGKLIEVGKTEKIFKNPDNKMTQDYITGRLIIKHTVKSYEEELQN